MKINLAAQLRQNLHKRKAQKARLDAAAGALVVRQTGDSGLNGVVEIAGAKNAALPMMIASLLTDEEVRLENLPDLSDVNILADILVELGCEIGYQKQQKTMALRCEETSSNSASNWLVKQMRASFWIIAPLLVRCGEAKVFLPGGDDIGRRGMEIYLDGLKALGAEVELNDDSVGVRARRLKGARFELAFPSVGASHVLLMAASLAEGETELVNVAREPEIVALANMLNAMGAKIEGIGSEKMRIEGVARLSGVRQTIPNDRIEAGTYIIASAICGGVVRIKNAPLDQLGALLDCLRAGEIGFDIEGEDIIVRRRVGEKIVPVDVITAPYPGFPTDLQAQWMALMTQAKGCSSITENMFENRFQHIAELNLLGADIRREGKKAVIDGLTPLKGVSVNATDIRASASLVIAALVAGGETRIQNIHHLERGFEMMQNKLNACGADIKRIGG